MFISQRDNTRKRHTRPQNATNRTTRSGVEIRTSTVSRRYGAWSLSPTHVLTACSNVVFRPRPITPLHCCPSRCWPSNNRHGCSRQLFYRRSLHHQTAQRFDRQELGRQERRRPSSFSPVLLRQDARIATGDSATGLRRY
uniref:Uncharacterized protein n=1 Tax=Ixodes ricinus TaxID=34613 RepID=V5HGH7_IXORI